MLFKSKNVLILNFVVVNHKKIEVVWFNITLSLLLVSVKRLIFDTRMNSNFSLRFDILNVRMSPQTVI